MEEKINTSEEKGTEQKGINENKKGRKHEKKEKQTKIK